MGIPDELFTWMDKTSSVMTDESTGPASIGDVLVFSYMLFRIIPDPIFWLPWINVLRMGVYEQGAPETDLVSTAG